MGKAELKTKLTAEITDLGSQIAAAKKEGKPKDEVSHKSKQEQLDNVARGNV